MNINLDTLPGRILLSEAKTMLAKISRGNETLEEGWRRISQMPEPMLVAVVQTTLSTCQDVDQQIVRVKGTGEALKTWPLYASGIIANAQCIVSVAEAMETTDEMPTDMFATKRIVCDYLEHVALTMMTAQVLGTIVYDIAVKIASDIDGGGAIFGEKFWEQVNIWHEREKAKDEILKEWHETKNDVFPDEI